MGEEIVEGPLKSKRDCMGDDGQSFSVEVGNISRERSLELPQEKFRLLLKNKKVFKILDYIFQWKKTSVLDKHYKSF